MSNSFAKFYSGKKILVTGHTGFKGGWLTAWLKLLGAKVIGFALPPETTPNLFTSASIAESTVSVFGDIRDLSAVSSILKVHAPDIVIHSAAQPLVRRSYRDPVETYSTNVMGTVHVLEASRHTPSVRSVVIITSDKCYDNKEWSRGYREGDTLGGHDPYSSSKGAAELVTAAYRRSFYSQDGSAAVASARAGNVIGGGDWSQDRLVPDIVRGITSSQSITLRRPDSIRPWQHVLEPLRGYLLLAQRLWEEGQSFAEAWNFGPREQDSISVADLARRMVSFWGQGQLKIEPDPLAPHEAHYLRLNSEKSHQQLGWKPAIAIEQAIGWTVEWYRAFYDDAKQAGCITESQIQRYMRVAGI